MFWGWEYYLTMFEKGTLLFSDIIILFVQWYFDKYYKISNANANPAYFLKLKITYLYKITILTMPCTLSQTNLKTVLIYALTFQKKIVLSLRIALKR